MKDKLLDFGTLSAFGASSSESYCENTLDFGVDQNFLGSGPQCKVVFIATKATTAFTPKLYSGSTVSPSDVYAQGPAVATLAIGEKVELVVPLKLARYVRAGGVATSGGVTAHIEMGGSN